MKKADVARMIDHTLLKPEATVEQINSLISEGMELGVFSVCVSPNQLPIQTPAGMSVATVCGFPSGAHASAVKATEARIAVENGADEVDMVVNLKFVKEGRFSDVQADIQAVRDACKGALLKVIIESAALTDDEIIACCHACEAAGADFVKTSTGFHPAGGASVHAVKLMRETVGDRLGVKASGGIRDGETAAAMIAAGANRLGLSSSAAVLSYFEN